MLPKYSIVGGASTTNWRPWPMRLPFLLFFTLLCLALIFVLELLIQTCTPDGCPILGNSSANHVSSLSAFVYNSLPTIIGILFGMTWAVASHDYLRMEPWFQLSKPSGALAEDSLLLEYSYEFPLFVPFNAAKQGHFCVMIASIMALFTTLVLTPLSSGLLDDSPLNLTSTLPTVYSTSPSLDPSFPSTTPAQHSATFAYTAYSHAWLNSSLPPFTTPSFALSPWPLTPVNSTWTGLTSLFEADLTCTDAIRTPISAPDVGIVGYLLTNNDNTSYHGIWNSDFINFNYSDWLAPLEESQPRVFWSAMQWFVGTVGFSEDTLWQSLDMVPAVGEGGTDTKRANGTVLFVFGDVLEAGLPKRWGAVFCEPRYWVSSVNATVAAPTGVVGGVVGGAERRRVDDAPMMEGFWERLLSGELGIEDKYIDGADRRVGLGYPPQQLPHMDSQLQRRFGARREEPVLLISALSTESKSLINVKHSSRGFTSFALYAQSNDTLEGLLDGEALAGMYSDAFKLLFAMLCADTLQRDRVDVETVVETKREVRGYRVNLLWSRFGQGALALMAVLTCVLVVCGWSKRCNLDGEPNSLAVSLGMMQRSPEMVRRMGNSEFHSPKVFRELVRRSGERYRVVLVDGEGPRMEIVGGNEVRRKLPGGVKPWEAKRGWPVNRWSGMALVGLFVVILVLLLVVYSYARANNGIPTIASPNSFGFKVLFSYFPTILALAAEPLLSSLGSYYCMLGPYKALHEGNASSKRSLSIDYDSSPPHFQIFKAFQSRHFSLGGLTVAIILSNVLATALAGLFSLKNIDRIVELEIPAFKQPVVVGEFTVPAEEMSYRLSSSISGEKTLPPWTTSDYYLLPVILPTTNSTTLLSTSISTMGFGASISCAMVPPSSIDSYCKGEKGTKIPCPAIAATSSIRKETYVNETCWPEGELTGYAPLSTLVWYDSVYDNFIRSPDCPDTFFAVWSEQAADPHPNGTRVLKQKIDTAVLRCFSTESVVRLNATVDPLGNVISVDQASVIPLGPSETDALYPNGPATNKSTRLVPTFLDAIDLAVSLTDDMPQDSINLRWFNHLMVQLNSNISQTVGPNITHIPDISLLPRAFETVFKKLYSINLSLYGKDVLKTSDTADAGNVIVESTVVNTRVMVSMPMFIVAAIVSGYVIILLMMLYWGPGRLRYITHDPTCLAGMWTALYASDAKDDCGDVRGRNPKERAKQLAMINGSYSYGTFKAADGRTHVGVFRERIVKQKEVDNVQLF